MGVAERRRRERQERRCCILDAAERVFLRKGINAATMDEIAQESELSKGALYLYFENKDELYLQVALRSLEALVDAFERTLRKTQAVSGRERTRRLMETYANFAAENPSRFRVATAWIGSNEDIVHHGETFHEHRRLIAKLVEHAVQAIEVGKRDGSISGHLNSRHTVLHIWGALLGMLTLALNAAPLSRRLSFSVDMDQLIPSFLNLLERALDAEKAAFDTVKEASR
jgi:AcrR family transcriptional regulator